MDSNSNGRLENLNSQELEEFESSGLEKLIGIFVEPVRIFKSIKQFGSNIYDWLFPILFFLITLLLADLMVTAIPSIRFSMLEKQATEIREKFAPLIADGTLTEEAVNEEIETLKKHYADGLTSTKLTEAFYITVIELFKFLVIFLFFHFLIKYLHHGEIKFRDSLTALGLPLYIKAFGNVFLIIAGLITSTYLSDMSIATLAGISNDSIFGFLLHKSDLFSIWYFLLVAFGFIVMHRLSNKYKVIVVIFSAWISSGLFFFWLVKLFGYSGPNNL
ncbi:MAG: hypothetical protein SCALA702_17440 [Melioribacteraceae bacterium]|nr:MAG: hypothetical protein SCALA702_17440 [Melioribacteraceae bacterium]